MIKKLAAEQKKDLHYAALPTPMRKLPSRSEIHSILREIDQAIRLGHVVYIHDYNSQVTETIMGCYLVQQGMTGTQAIKELERSRKGMREDGDGLLKRKTHGGW